MDNRRRFLHGLADTAGLTYDMLDRPGTALRANEDRTGSGILLCYWAGEHGLLWGDAELLAELGDLASDHDTIDRQTAEARITALGVPLEGAAEMRVLDESPAPPPPIPSGYRQRWLQSELSADVDLVRAFADRNDPDEVEDAALDELDEFDESAINVLLPEGSDDPVAYASAAPWDWDPEFADIGVLVDPAHRLAGLATVVVGHTTAALHADGRLPLYRHGQSNQGSQRVAIANGFQPATTLLFFCRPEA